MSEVPYGLPEDVLAGLQPPESVAKSDEKYSVDIPRCPAACCNWSDPYWWRYSTTREQEDARALQLAESRSLKAAWEALHGPWPKDNYWKIQQDYWEDWPNFERNWINAGRIICP